MHALAWSIWSDRENEVEQMPDDGLAGTPAAGLIEQIQDEQLAGELAAGIAGTGAPSRPHRSFSQCKMRLCESESCKVIES
jgi:hypothetical protein